MQNSTYRISKNRRKLLKAGYTIDEIINNNITTIDSKKVKLLVNNKTDSEILKNQDQFFTNIIDMVNGVCNGDITSLIISGGPGIGKSYSIENRFNGDNITMIKGKCTPIKLYVSLYENRNNKQILVFDDSDGIFNDELSLNVLKNALGNGNDKLITWLSNVQLKDSNGAPIDQRFTYNGSVIFVTNKNLMKMATANIKLSSDISALISRSYYIDGYKAFTCQYDYMLRINQIKDTIYKTEHINIIGQDIINNFIEENYKIANELSLRFVIKLCELYKMFAGNVEKFKIAAKLTLCK